MKLIDPNKMELRLKDIQTSLKAKIFELGEVLKEVDNLLELVEKYKN